MYYTQATPAPPSFELQFPPDTMTDDRAGHLARQAHVLEHAGYIATDFSPSRELILNNPGFLAYYAADLADTFGPMLHQRPEIDLVETQIAISGFFNTRQQHNAVNSGAVLALKDALQTFDTPEIQQAISPLINLINGVEDANDPRIQNTRIGVGAFTSAHSIGQTQTYGPCVAKVSLFLFEKLLRDSSFGKKEFADLNVRRWMGLIAGKGIDGLEQLVGLSAEQHITITSQAPGATLKRISEQATQPKPTDMHIYKLADTVREVIQNGISLDPNAGNILYDEEAGFTLIDYGKYSTVASMHPAHFRTNITGLIRTVTSSFNGQVNRNDLKTTFHDFTDDVLQQMES